MLSGAGSMGSTVDATVQIFQRLSPSLSLKGCDLVSAQASDA